MTALLLKLALATALGGGGEMPNLCDNENVAKEAKSAPLVAAPVEIVHVPMLRAARVEIVRVPVMLAAPVEIVSVPIERMPPLARAGR